MVVVVVAVVVVVVGVVVDASVVTAGSTRVGDGCDTSTTADVLDPQATTAIQSSTTTAHVRITLC